jgi:hypothetical protein
MPNPSNLVPFPLGVAEKLRLRQEDLITVEDIHALLCDPMAKEVYDEMEQWLRDNNQALFGPQMSERLGDTTIL